MATPDGYVEDFDFCHSIRPGMEVKTRGEWLEVTEVDFRRNQKIRNGYRVYLHCGDRVFCTNSLTAWKFRYKAAAA